MVSNLFNTFFVSVADHIGTSRPLSSYENVNNILDEYENHESILKIKAHSISNGTFNFRPISENDVSKLIQDIKVKKATGFDGIPPKLLKAAKEELSIPLSNMINTSIMCSSFPDDLKCAEVSPIFKKQDNLIRNNYRPVSVLPVISKLFERTYYNQMYDFFQVILSSYLAAFRQNYGCNHVLLKFVEDMKYALDQKEHFGAILMDLSKAFDCLPHPLLICKLHAYGFSLKSCELICSYLSNRKQRVKVGGSKSDWCYMKKGVPQGSILGPLLFNVFINDIYYFLQNMCVLYNYADDNNIGYSHSDLDTLLHRLENCGSVAIKWFKSNDMEANPSKFQGLLSLYGNQRERAPEKITIANVEIPFSINVKLLGVTVDSNLSFDTHVSDICKKSSRYLRAISRVSKYLSTECRQYLYNAFVVSNFHYCNIVWHLCGTQNTIKIEKINRRALKIIFNDYRSSYIELLDKADQPNLYTSRIHSIALETYRSLKRLNPPFLHDCFTYQVENYELRNVSQLELPRVRTIKYGINSYRYQGAKIWNSLTLDIMCAESPKQMKSLLKDSDTNRCNCNTCDLCQIKRM